LWPRVIGAAVAAAAARSQLNETPASLPQSRAHTVSAGVAASDHNHVLALCGQIKSILVIAVQQTFCVRVKKLHREMNALQISSFDRKIRGLVAPHKAQSRQTRS